MAQKKLSKSKIVSYAAISAALGSILLTIGAYTGLGEFFWYFAAGVCVMITFPLNSLAAGILSFIVCSTISLMSTGFNFIFLLPYFVFFGAYPLSLYIEHRYNVNRWIMTAVTYIWFIASLYVMYLFTKLFVAESDFVKNNILILLPAIGTVIFILFRFVMKRIDTKLSALLKKLKL